MNWLNGPAFERRPLVLVEDHLYHTGELLTAMASARADLLSQVTAIALDRGGPDTDAAVADWRRRYPEVQVAAAVTGMDAVRSLAESDVADNAACARTIASCLRPGGVLIQDVQLSTLPFVPADRWWESIYLAATVRGLFGDRAPAVRFLSNKRGYAATFGRELMEASFDPRDVMDKAEYDRTVLPAIAGLVDRAFPSWLDARLQTSTRRRWFVGGDADRHDIEATLDLVVTDTAAGVEIAGRLVGAPGERIAIRTGSPEATTWAALVENRLNGGDGLTVVDVGRRIGPPGADRAELTNLAARHIHTLRSRIVDSGAILTINHAYRFGDAVSVGVVRARPKI